MGAGTSFDHQPGRADFVLSISCTLHVACCRTVVAFATHQALLTVIFSTAGTKVCSTPIH